MPSAQKALPRSFWAAANNRYNEVNMKQKIISFFVLIIASVFILTACKNDLKPESYKPFTAEAINVPAYANPYNLYVDVNGEDINNGTVSEPLKTLQAAVDKLKLLQQDTDITSANDCFIININKGLYNIDNAVLIDEKITETLPVIICGDKDEMPVLSGGRQFKGGFSLYQDGIYKMNVGTEKFREIYIDGKTAIRARYPDLDKSNIATGGNIEVAWDKTAKELKFGKYEMAGFPTDVTGMEVIMWQEWVTTVGLIDSMNETSEFYNFKIKNIDNVETTAFSRDYPSKSPQSTRGWFENNLAFLNAEGEWYHDYITGDLYYKPAEGENINEITVTIPHTEQLLEIKGSGVGEGERVKNLTVENIRFEYTNWAYPSTNGYIEHQAGQYVKYFYSDASTWNVELYHPKSAIEMFYAKDVYFVNNAIKNTAANGISLRAGTDSIYIQGNRIENTGVNGISMGFYEEKDSNLPELLNYLKNTNSEYVTKNIHIQFNLLYNIGKSYTGIGISGGYQRDIYIYNNEINTCSYDGIGMGWGWASSNTVNGNFQIKSNRIINTMNSYLNDGGGIYMLGKHLSDYDISEIKDNYFSGEGGCVIYFDDTSNDFIVDHNVLDGDNKWGCLHIHDIGTRLENITINNTYTTTGRYLDLDYGIKTPTKESRNVIISEPVVKSYSTDWPEDAYIVKSNAGLTAEFEYVKNL